MAAQQFADIATLSGQVERFIEISWHCYERATDWLAAERRERHPPAFARTVAREQAALDAIVRGLLVPASADSVTVALVKTLVDFPFWHALTAAGLPHPDIPPLMFCLVVDQLHHAGINTGARTRRRTNDSARARQPRTTTPTTVTAYGTSTCCEHSRSRRQPPVARSVSWSN